MAIDVRSEVRPLKKVLLQRPGRELEQLVPNSMERLLFDDIPYLRGAQTEHDRFAQVLRDSGVEVVYLTDLAAETLALSDSLRRRFVEDFIRSSGCVAASYREALTELLLACPNTRELIRKTMTGVRFDELPLHQNHSLASLRNDRTHFVLEPIPNLYFTRDPFASIGRGVCTTCTPSHATARRSTETISCTITPIMRARCRFTTRRTSRTPSRAAIS